jgi:hypothetical protein
MISGDEGSLTLTVGMRVSPEPEVIDLLERYRNALNYSIRKIIGHKRLHYQKSMSYFTMTSRRDLDFHLE